MIPCKYVLFYAVGERDEQGIELHGTIPFVPPDEMRLRLPFAPYEGNYGEIQRVLFVCSTMWDAEDSRLVIYLEIDGICIDQEHADSFLASMIIAGWVMSDDDADEKEYEHYG